MVLMIDILLWMEEVHKYEAGFGPARRCCLALAATAEANNEGWKAEATSLWDITTYSQQVATTPPPWPRFSFYHKNCKCHRGGGLAINFNSLIYRG
jgi:hypothetical protein